MLTIQNMNNAFFQFHLYPLFHLHLDNHTLFQKKIPVNIKLYHFIKITTKSHDFFYKYVTINISESAREADEMEKAIFSRVDLDNENCILANEYLDCIKDLIDIEDVQGLKEFSQHLKTSRFQHSLNVSYYSFLLARRFHLDAYSIARAGLLHDLYFYDWREKETRPMEGRHCSIHPQIALDNAKKACSINPVMEDCIVHHMWPMTIHCPKTKEGWVVQAVDKYCAVSEMLLQSGRKLKASHVSFYFMAFISILR